MPPPGRVSQRVPTRPVPDQNLSKSSQHRRIPCALRLLWPLHPGALALSAAAPSPTSPEAQMVRLIFVNTSQFPRIATTGTALVRLDSIHPMTSADLHTTPPTQSPTNHRYHRFRQDSQRHQGTSDGSTTPRHRCHFGSETEVIEIFSFWLRKS